MPRIFLVGNSPAIKICSLVEHDEHLPYVLVFRLNIFKLSRNEIFAINCIGYMPIYEEQNGPQTVVQEGVHRVCRLTPKAAVLLKGYTWNAERMVSVDMSTLVFSRIDSIQKPSLLHSCRMQGVSKLAYSGA